MVKKLDVYKKKKKPIESPEQWNKEPLTIHGHRMVNFKYGIKVGK